METVLLSKITRLAVQADRPLIIVANPNKSDTSRFGHYNYIANIGDAYAGFEGYNVLDLVDLYADLKGQLDNAKNSQQGDDVASNTSSSQA